MKVVSINAEQTISPLEIAFNVSEDLSSEFIERIDFGHLKFSGSGRTLIVKLPDEATEPFNSRSLRTLNQELMRIADEYAKAAEKRRQMLEFISANTGLKLE